MVATRESQRLGMSLGFKGETYNHIEEGEYKNELLDGYRMGELIKQETLESIDFPMPSSISSPEFQQILGDYFDLQYFRARLFDTWIPSLSKFLGNNMGFNKNVPSLYNGINIKLLESLEKKCLNEYLIVLKLKIKYLKATRDYKQDDASRKYKQGDASRKYGSGDITKGKDKLKDSYKELKKEIYS